MRLIDADATKKLAQEHLIDPYHIVSACAVIDKAETIDAVPAVRAKFVIGKAGYVCSNCSKKPMMQTDNEGYYLMWPKYCPHCGARMDG